MRTDAAGSFENACRHLFRHLHDVRELRGNPLSERFFRSDASDELARDAVLDAVRVALERCVRDDAGEGNAERAQRYRAIVERCDLRNESHREVWEALGLSRRQFYRERLRICRRIATLIAADRRTDALTCSESLDDVALARGRTFVELGAAETGLALLCDVGREAGDSDTRVAAWCSAARILAARWRIGEAAAALEAAQTIVCSRETEASALEEADVAFTRAELEHAAGNRRTAKPLSKCAIPALRSLASFGGRRERELFVQALASQGDRLAELGDYAAAFRAFETARTVLATVNPVSPQRLSEVLLGWGLTLSCLPAVKTDASVRAFEEAFEIATSLGFVNRSALGSMALASFHWYVGGDRERAQRYLEAAYAVEPALDDQYVRWYVASEGAAIELALDRPTRALEVVAQAECAPEGSSEWAGAQYTRARALLRTGNAQIALRVARGAGRAADRLARRGLQGAVLRLMAESYVMLGKRAQAVECIGEAIALLERYGNVNQLALGYRTSAAITGNLRHARRAAAIGRTV
jgi:tetratricopeptide (TPR) repeat protein